MKKKIKNLTIKDCLKLCEGRHKGKYTQLCETCPLYENGVCREKTIPTIMKDFLEREVEVDE